MKQNEELLIKVLWSPDHLWSVSFDDYLVKDLVIDEAMFTVFKAMMDHTPKDHFTKIDLKEARRTQKFLNKHGDKI